jgi:choline dehydrogenase-like flavoprotein
MIVLAAHSIESARILLLSKIGNDQVGKNLMDHLQGYGWGFTKQPIYPFRGPPTTSGIDCFRDGEFRKEYAPFRMSLGNDGWGRLSSPDLFVKNLVENEGLFGEQLKERIEHDFTRMLRISYSTEVLPQSDNYISLSHKVDALGIQKPELHFVLNDYNLKAFEKAESVIRNIFSYMKMDNIQVSDRKNYSGAGHIIGTCRMGLNAQEAVVDSYGQSFQHPNLFIVGCSVFPTSGTANPTLTAVALTLRTIRKIQETLPVLG